MISTLSVPTLKVRWNYLLSSRLPQKNIHVGYIGHVQPGIMSRAIDQTIKIPSYDEVLPLTGNPDVSSIASLLQKFAKTKDILHGKSVHDYIIRTGLEKDRFLANLLVQMYGKCGALPEARAVFDGMNRRNSFTWNLMILAYAQNGQMKQAQQLFDHMPERNVIVWNTMISGYARERQLQEAVKLFEKMPYRDIISWTAMLSAYVQHGQLQEAHSLFNQMPEKCDMACNTLIAGYAQKGLLNNALKLLQEMSCRSVISWTSVISGYMQQGRLDEALDVFRKMPERDVVSWNVMISGYAHQGRVEEALSLFQQMPQKDVVSWNTMIGAYAQQGKVKDAFHLFQNMPQRDVVSWNAMIGAYVQVGQVDKALEVFQKMPQPNVVSWNAMISAYAQQGNLKETLNLFNQMNAKGMTPDKVTFISIVDACASKTAIVEGKHIHNCILGCSFEWDVALCNALVNMYGKCGELGDARLIFEKMIECDIVSWNTMVGAYAQRGYSEDAMQLFQEMKVRGVVPDQVTFISVLSACSRGGLVNEGYHHFVSMAEGHSLTPTMEHYNCMVDHLGRGGRLAEAESLIIEMPFEADLKCWRALLGSCPNYVISPIMGRRIAEHVVQLDPDGSAAYVLLSNIYANYSQVGEHATVFDKALESRNKLISYSDVCWKLNEV